MTNLRRLQYLIADTFEAMAGMVRPKPVDITDLIKGAHSLIKGVDVDEDAWALAKDLGGQHVELTGTYNNMQCQMRGCTNESGDKPLLFDIPKAGTFEIRICGRCAALAMMAAMNQ